MVEDLIRQVAVASGSRWHDNVGKHHGANCNLSGDGGPDANAHAHDDARITDGTDDAGQCGGDDDGCGSHGELFTVNTVMMHKGDID